MTSVSVSTTNRKRTRSCTWRHVNLHGLKIRPTGSLVDGEEGDEDYYDEEGDED
jgi:hypothetical protein